MSVDKVKASKAKVYSPPDGVPADAKQVHVYVYDVFNGKFLPGKSFDNVERAVQYQRHEQERIFNEQEAEPELFDLPFLSRDADLLARIERDPEYRKRLVRDLGSDARGRARRR